MELLLEYDSLSDIAIDKAINNHEIMTASIYHDYMENVAIHGETQHIFEFSFDQFRIQAIDFIHKLLKILIDFFNKIKTEVHIQIQKHNVNKKLEELKELLAAKKSKAMNERYSYIDTKRYKEYYTAFIDRYTTEIIRGLNTDFKDINEYDAWRRSMLNKLNDFNYKLSDTEQWKLTVAINSAVELTDKEARNREDNLKLVNDMGSKALKTFESFYNKLPIEGSAVNGYDNKRILLIKAKNSLIGNVCSEFVKATKMVLSFISKHTIASIIAILSVLLLL